jgi:hypothetical protein
MPTKKPTPQAKTAAKTTKQPAKAVKGAKAVKPSATPQKPSNLDRKIANLTKEETPAKVIAGIRKDAEKAAAGGGSPPKGKTQEQKRSVGRPTKYEPRFAQELIAYFAASSDVWDERILKTAGGGERVELLPKKFPTLARFSTMIDVNFTTVYRWAHEKDEQGNPVNAEFCNAYAHAKALQEAILIEGGMAGVYQSQFVVLAAKNIIGWREKIEQTTEDVTGLSPKEKADMERSYQEAMQAGVWQDQKAAMQARKKELDGAK